MESGGGFFTTIQNIMAVAADKEYLNDTVLAYLGFVNWCLAYSVDTNDVRAKCLPSEDILCVVISQIHCSRPTYWDSYSLSVVCFQKIRCL